VHAATAAETTSPTAVLSAPTGSTTGRELKDGTASRLGASRGFSFDKAALVVLVAIMALALAFIVMVFANVSAESIIALAVIAVPIASMVAAYYGITLSMQQVRSERAEKEKAVARAETAAAASRETEVWAAQMEAGLRVALVKLNAAGVGTSEVTKAAGAPDDFF
jgi:hypothetical protein